ncbi:MAG: dUTP diphosphatase [Mariprofundales bacterium]|nr:dUTP diphosphatase [Mariprofundales bacterium]
MMKQITITIQRLANGDGVALPHYASSHAAGADIRAAVRDDLVLAPGARALIPGGFAIALPDGFEAQVRPRSGLALKKGVTVLNAPGTIDADYRGEVGVILINHGSEPFTVQRGDRIAQLVIAPCVQAAWELAPDLDETTRGAKGFGSTGHA